MQVTHDCDTKLDEIGIQPLNFSYRNIICDADSRAYNNASMDDQSVITAQHSTNKKMD